MVFNLKFKRDDKPYLSIVIAARNDGHGLHFLDRMQIFISSIFEQLTKYHLISEIIIVEWNPLHDLPRLSQAISWPSNHSSCKIRIIEVPAEIHKTFDYSNKIFLHQMIAKNVGIRRAKGQFVLATTADILFSDELVRFLASKSLKTNYFYRVDRYDVKKDVPYPASIEEQLNYCKRNVTKIYTKDGDFMPYELHKIKEKSGYLSFRWMKNKDWNEPYPKLHTNASGDFTLMAKEKWHELFGYPELEMYPIHHDSLMLHMAYQYGLREKILKDPMRIYHIEHSGGWNPQKADEILQGYKNKGIPFITIEQFQLLVSDMNRKKLPIIFNKDSWGVGSENLKEEFLN